MTTPISEFVSVSVTIGDRLLQQAGFGTPLVFGLATAPSGWASGQRTASYASMTEVAVDWAVTTKIYRACSAIFSGARAPVTVKVGLELSADSGNQTTALNAIESYDPDWYCLITTHRTEAALNAIAAWIEAADSAHIAILCSEDTTIPNSGDSSGIASDLEGFAYNRSALLYHHNGGADVTDASSTVASEVATITKAGHGLRVGDSVVISGCAETATNGVKTVLSVPLSSTFTVASAGGSDGADGNNGSIVYFARYDFPEARWAGHMLPTTPGAETWAFKPLTGQTPTPTSLLSYTQQTTVKGKTANMYTTIGGIGATWPGKMASGRFIDNQIGIDWISTRFAEVIAQRLVSAKKVPYTDGGTAVLRADLASVCQQGVNNGLLALLTNTTSGEYWRITIPSVADISASDRANRNLPDVNVEVRFAGAIHNVTVALTVEL